MKRNIVIIFFLLIATTLFAQNVVLDYFHANSDGNSVTLKWKSVNEANIVRYDIQRSKENSFYTKIESIDPRGNGSIYNYTDEEVFMRPVDGTEETSNYSYRIKYVFHGGQAEYSETEQVNHKVNSIRRTWGMIKEMFR